MAKATRTPGTPEIPASTREERVVVHNTSVLRGGDVVVQSETDSKYPAVVREVKVPGVPAVPGEVILVLSEEEAAFLVDVTRAIGGPAETRRRFSDAILSALLALRTDDDEDDDYIEWDHEGSIYFK